MLVCVKVGENESKEYEKYSKLSKHMEIVDVLPRGVNSMGTMGDKEFLAIEVADENLSDYDYEQLRFKLKTPIYETVSENVFRIKEKRSWVLRDSKLDKAGLSEKHINTIKNLNKKRENTDLSEINKGRAKIKYEDFIEMITHKETKKTLKDTING